MELIEEIEGMITDNFPMIDDYEKNLYMHLIQIGAELQANNGYSEEELAELNS